MREFTAPLRSGAKLPSHPSDTTARKIISYGEVADSQTGMLCVAGLHQNEIATLQRGEKMGLGHLHRYAIRDGRIYHTRPRVVIAVETEDVET